MNDYLKIVQKSGYKLTKPRTKIIKFLESQSMPLTARSICRSLGYKIDLSSIYRSLNIFKKLNIVFEEEINREGYYYISEKHHHHIICRKCGYIECIPCTSKFYNVKNFKDISHKLALTGTCSKCGNG
ncbi:MAG: transcriptional repressor [Actinobacteria bacterium]|nr:transcriptional repressor [Actinomycetota bacterium]